MLRIMGVGVSMYPNKKMFPQNKDIDEESFRLRKNSLGIKEDIL